MVKRYRESCGEGTCDGSGDVHRADGEWLGECPHCKAEQPAAVDERAKFEAWQRKDGWKRPNDPGEWEAWQARAAVAPAASVVMPERMTTIPEGKTISYAAGYEAALDAVANLNRNTVPLELLGRISQWPCADHTNAIDELRAILGAKS